ncbi:DUF4270 domain-containing protein [Paracrocinitomix mangrovi]|uniref:DUF4270 family protein n=1 Tax=Paracrocinitomix mangrovi TaxID=2862509 RepID=UPI001C8D8044|nr:DUF4270 family protein [Paracrocinitomix mangrovi]UKN00633.1 DUF4270 domain-containing protein [Paracrocinitomix mangrovi]
MSKRRVFQLSATFFISIVLTLSCKKEETNIGNNLQGEGLNVIKSDTFTILTYTDTLDSMASDETSVSLLGYYNDPVFGSVDCGIVSQLRLSSSNPAFSANPGEVIVDSVVLGLQYTSIKWYANLGDPITVEAYEITDDLVRDDQDYYIFQEPNTTGSNLVVTGTEVIYPDVLSDVTLDNGDTLSAHLRINLDPTLLGDKLVAINEAGNMTSDDAFVSAFKGIYVKVNGSGLAPNQGSVLYFALENPLSKVTLYFHTVSDPTSKEYDFNINSSAARYNRIEYNRTGTSVYDVLVDSTNGQNEFYTQGGSAWAVIQLPHIKELNKDSLGNEDRKIINKAQLILPIQNFVSDSYDPPKTLFIARIVDKNNSEFTLDYNISNSLSSSTVAYSESAKEYRFNLTLEIQAILNGEIENKGYRIYAPSFFASSIERVIFNGPNSSLKNRARLEITYTDY